MGWRGEEFFDLMIRILAVGTGGCFVVWVMGFVLFGVGWGFFGLFGDM